MRHANQSDNARIGFIQSNHLNMFQFPHSDPFAVDCFLGSPNYRIFRIFLIKKSFEGIIMKKFFAILAFLQLWIAFSGASCCFTKTPKFLSPSNFYLDIAAVSSGKDYSKVQVNYPLQYITGEEKPKSAVSSASFSCSKSGNKWSCSDDQPIFNATWRLFTPGNQNGAPEVDVLIAGETCQLDTWCKGFDEATVTANSGDEDAGKIDLGPLGKVSSSVFWPVMVGIIITMVGMGYLAYTRKKPVKSSDLEAQEESMTKGGNGAGWFGEKKPDAEYRSKNGKVTSLKENDSRESKPSIQSKSSIDKSSRSKKHRRNKNTSREEDDSSDDDDSEVDMSRVVKVHRNKSKADNSEKNDRRKSRKPSDKKPESSSKKPERAPSSNKRQMPKKPLIQIEEQPKK